MNFWVHADVMGVIEEVFMSTQDKKLDKAIEKSFPASDPVTVGKATGTEPAKRPVDRQPPVISKEEVEAAERGEGHAHRDLEPPSQEKARRQKHHGVGDAGLNADDTAEKTEVDGHGGLGSCGGPRDT
jgi:hypothetical protein